MDSETTSELTWRGWTERKPPKMNFLLCSVLSCSGPNGERQCCVGGVMILALNRITNRFRLQIRTRVSNQPSGHAVLLESLCKLTAQHMAGNNAYRCMSAWRWWVWIDLVIAAMICSGTRTCWGEALTSQRSFFVCLFVFFDKLKQNNVKWNGYFSCSGAERLSCRPGFAWNRLQPNYCWLLWSGGWEEGLDL